MKRVKDWRDNYDDGGKRIDYDNSTDDNVNTDEE